MAAATSTSPSQSSALNRATLNDLLDYWFQGLEENRDAPPPQQLLKKWYFGGKEVDEHCHANYAGAVEATHSKTVDELEAFVKDSPKDVLALLLLLDQMPRNIYRGDEAKKAYTVTDPKGLELCKRFIAEPYKYDRRELWSSWFHQSFILMPLMHSEDLQDHRLLQSKYDAALEEATSEEEKKCIQQGKDFGIKHQKVLEKFGRYPSRNACLGRESTAEEAEHLEKHGQGW